MVKSVLLVDDNRKILELLRAIIPWKEAGFVLAGLAEDGKEALAIAKVTPADILVTDMKMPVMDGLELICNFRKLYPGTKILVLSSYNEFRLVREAFKLGSSEYILKTELEAEQFIKLLNHFSAEIDAEREEKRAFDRNRSEVARFSNADSDSRRELFENRRYIKDRLLNQLVHGYIKVDELLKKDLKSLGLRFSKGYYRVMLISIDNFKSMLENVWNGDEQLFSFVVLNMLDEIFEGYFTADSFYTSQGELAVICYAENKEEIAGLDEFQKAFDTLKDILATYLKVKLSAGICAASDQACLKELYESASQACRSRFIYGQGKLLCEEENFNSDQKMTMKLAERVEYLRSALKSMNPDILRKGYEILCIGNREVNIKEYGEVTRLFEKYSLVINEFAEVNGMMEVCSSYLSKFDDSNYDIWPVEQLNQWLIDLLNAISGQLITYNDVVRNVILYVRTNYFKAISLQSVAEEMGINRSHLSRLIKKELGTTFIEYLNNFRIDKAKELMARGSYKLYEVSVKCGYGSFEHFSRTFKKLTGTSPKEWDLCLTHNVSK